MNAPLAEFLQRKPFKGGMTPAQALAANVLWRDGEPLSAIARWFGVSRNTLYYKVVNGHAPSYPHTASNWSSEINDLVEVAGVDAIRRLREVRKALDDAELHKAIDDARAA